MPDYVLASTSTSAALRIGSFVDGTIETGSDHDWYRVSLIRGQTYVFATDTADGTVTDTVLTLRNSAGLSLVEDDDSGRDVFSRLTFTPTTSGSYYLDVGTYGGDTGGFRLSATILTTSTYDAVAGDAGTAATLATGGSVSGNIDTLGDHDWYGVALTAGETYVFRTVATGGNDVDTTITLRDGAGNRHAFNDDGGSGSFSHLRFTAPTSGTYFVDVGAFDDDETGSFRLTMERGVAPSVYSNDQIAAQLSSGYWEGGTRHFAVAAGGTLTYSITQLSADGQNLARQAFDLWSDATGLRFRETATGAQITIDNDGTLEASTGYTLSNGIIRSASISISADWLTRYGTGTSSYSFQTFVHEIGHALGLGHAGNYNDDAEYGSDALFLNDSWATSVMSYFDQNEATYFKDQGFSRQYALTPTAVDAIATTSIYGAATGTRTGDTTYGFNATADRPVYDARVNAAGGYTIFDNGGVDTLDYSGFGQAQVINLNAETFSSVGGGVGNVAIARGAVIENALGGTGRDTLIGNAAANVLNGGASSDLLKGGAGSDTLSGGGGNDIFAGTPAELGGDVILDFERGDRLLFTGLGPGAFSYDWSGGSLRFEGQVVRLLNYSDALVLRLPDAGTAMFAAPGLATRDFIGDGRSDILWRNTDGAISVWNVAGNGTSVQQGALNERAAPAWKIVEAFDHDGDGQADILWRNDQGSVAVWNSTGIGFDQSAYYRADAVPLAWRIAATGDVDADGRDDVIWQEAGGALSIWRSTTSGFQEASYSHAPVAQEWKVVGAGDFDGNGRADLLWRSTGGGVAMWSNAGAGTSFNEGAFYQPDVSSAWHIDGIGDFDGDGRDDILWRNDTGSVTVWRSNGAGFDQGRFDAYAATDWQIAQVGDFDGDGRADISWRHETGGVSLWRSNGSGFDQGIYNGYAPPGWSVAGHDFIL